MMFVFVVGNVLVSRWQNQQDGVAMFTYTNLATGVVQATTDTMWSTPNARWGGLHTASGWVVGNRYHLAVVNPLAVIWRLVAVAEPRLRRVMLGEASVERARLGAAVAGFSLERNAAEPAQALPLQVPVARTALRRVEGSAVVGEL